jgi:Clostridial hydrophobic W
VIQKNRARAKRALRIADPGPTEVATEVLSFTRATAERTLGYPHLAAVASVVRLDQGLYALEIGGTPALPGQNSGLPLPAIQVSAPPSGKDPWVEIIGTSGDVASWIGHDGGTVVVKSPAGGGEVWVTAYGLAEHAVVPPHVEARRLDHPRSNGAATGSPSIVTEPDEIIVTEPDEIGTEIVLHVERLGDRSFPGRGWVGNRGRKLRIEAFSIRPAETLAARDIEFKALGPNGRQTPWVTDAKLCGTRGQGLPLTGFAIRLAPHVGDRFDAIYEGAFFESGVVGPYRNGALCIPAIADDPLEAINVRVIRRAAQ